MTNYVQDGQTLTIPAPGSGVVTGVPIQIGQLLIVPTVTAASGVSFAGIIRGVFSVTKVGSQAWTVGALVYWDAGNTRFTTTAAGNRLAGYAVVATGSGAGETTGVVYLDAAARADEAT